MSKKKVELVGLNVRVPVDLRRRLKIAAINAGMTLQELAARCIAEGLAKEEQQRRR